MSRFLSFFFFLNSILHPPFKPRLDLPAVSLWGIHLSAAGVLIFGDMLVIKKLPPSMSKKNGTKCGHKEVGEILKAIALFTPLKSRVRLRM